MAVKHRQQEATEVGVAMVTIHLVIVTAMDLTADGGVKGVMQIPEAVMGATVFRMVAMEAIWNSAEGAMAEMQVQVLAQTELGGMGGGVETPMPNEDWGDSALRAVMVSTGLVPPTLVVARQDKAEQGMGATGVMESAASSPERAKAAVMAVDGLAVTWSPPGRSIHLQMLRRDLGVVAIDHSLQVEEQKLYDKKVVPGDVVVASPPTRHGGSTRTAFFAD